jgi:hypothetical protein
MDNLISSPPVRSLRYLPLAFLVGQEGFVFFLPFLLTCIAVHLAVRATRG